MKRTLILLASISALAAARADLIVEQKMEGSVLNGTMKMKMKGDKVRIDMPAGPLGDMSSIVDVQTGDSTTLIHGSKMAMKMSGALAKQAIDSVKGAAPDAGAAKFQATGRKEKVGEYNAEVFTWASPAGMQTLWVTKDVPGFAKIKAQFDKFSKASAAGIGKGMTPDTSALPGVVVKTEMDLAGNKITSTVTSMKEENVDAAVFDVPKDYQEMAQPTLPAIPPPAPK